MPLQQALPVTAAPIIPHIQNPPTVLGQQLASNINPALTSINSNVVYDGIQQANYLAKTDMMLSNLVPGQMKPNLIPEVANIAAPSTGISNIPIDGIMSEAQFYQYQERLRKERE